MGLDDLKARLENLLASHTRAPDARAQAQGLHAAMVEFKTALAENRQARAAAERELAGEKRQLEAAVRRGGLAESIGDAETAQIARQFMARHEERLGLLTRKLSVIDDEIAYLEREYASLAARYQEARRSSGLSGTAPAPDPLGEREFDALKARADREAAEMAVKAQLEMLKKKMKDGG
jgi:hypothetical protein